ncbi:MAG TPA: gephyrin-like molybdotransferase Glp [Spirochaetota bacterium]|nr:gephyrin-like molybdotransferase Glp [Spirochaetota bacterium]
MTRRASMISVEEALKTILAEVAPLSLEMVPLFDAPGRVLARDVVASVNIPSVDNSAMDGYALVAADARGATKERAARLPVRGEVKAGIMDDMPVVTAGHAVRIMTGAPVPRGADAVIQFEDTAEEGRDVLVFREVLRGENIRRAGEDVSRGAVVLSKGALIRSAETGMLASLNYTFVPVSRRPRVAILSTGDEIVDLGPELRSGQIRNSNAYTLHSEVRRYGGDPCYLGIAPDTREVTASILREALEADVVITTGGVSAGRYDFVTEALEELGVEILIETISMKPGKPCVFGKKGATLFFGLPGNPVSTMVSFIQFVRPAMLRMMGARRIEKPLVHAVLAEDIKKKTGRTHFIRGLFSVRDGCFRVSTTGPQGSGILRSMSDANCLIIIPEDTGNVRAGETVLVQLIDHGEI